MTYIRLFACAALLLFAATLFSPTLPADDTWADFKGSVTFGEQYFLDNSDPYSAKFGQYKDVPNGLVAEALTLNWEPVDRVFFTLEARDIGQRDQTLAFTFGKEHLWRGTVLWKENPRLYGEDARSPYRYTGGGVFTLPDTLQNDVENEITDTAENIIMDLMMHAPSVDLGYQRKTGSARLEFFPTERLSLSLFAERERRNGTHNQAVGIYRSFNITELAVPINFQTDNASLNVAYNAPRFSLGGEYFFSNFKLQEDYIIWDHVLFLNDVYTGSDEIDPGRQSMSLFPNSKLRRWTVHGSLNLPKHTRITALVSQGSTTQSDRLLPFTISSNASFQADLATMLGGFSLPSNIDARHDTTVINFKVVTRPVDWLTLKAFWKQYDLQNKTRSITLPGYVEDDHAVTYEPRRNLPYDYDKTTWGASAKVHPLNWLGFGLGYSRENITRDWANVTDSDEDTLKATLDLDVTDWLFLRATGKWQERDTHEYASHYNQASFPGNPLAEYENFGVRRFNQTDRDRDFYALMVQVTPIEKLELYAELTSAESDYGFPKQADHSGLYTLGESDDGPHHGLLEDENRSWTLGVSFMPHPRLSGWVDYTYEKTEREMASRERRAGNLPNIYNNDPLAEWWTHTEERYETVTAGFDAELRENVLDLNVSLSHASGRGRMNTGWIPGGASSYDGDPDNGWGDWPATKDDLTMAQVFMNWHLRSNLDTGLRYTYEAWDGEDWQIDAMRPYMGYAGEDDGIFLGAHWDDYTNHIISLIATWTF